MRGHNFHRHYFESAKARDAAESPRTTTTALDVHTQILGDVAIVAFVRLTQSDAKTTRTEETRIWNRVTDAPTSLSTLGSWRLVHFHRSVPQSAYPTSQ